MLKIAPTALKGVGRRSVCVVVEKKDPDLTKRTAELREDGVEHVITMCRSQALRRPRQVPELTDGWKVQGSDQWSRQVVLWGPRATEEGWSPQRAMPHLGRSVVYGQHARPLASRTVPWVCPEEINVALFCLLRKQWHLYMNMTQLKKGNVFRKRLRTFWVSISCHAQT